MPPRIESIELASDASLDLVFQGRAVLVVFADRSGLPLRVVPALELAQARALGDFLAGAGTMWQVRLGALVTLRAMRAGDVVTMTISEKRTVGRAYWVDLQRDHQAQAARFLASLGLPETMD